MRKKRSVPEATVGFVITNSKRLSNLQSIGWNFSSKVVAGIQKRGILEMNGHWVALQDLSCFFGPPRAFLFNNNLVDTRSIERKEEKKKKRMGYCNTWAVNSFWDLNVSLPVCMEKKPHHRHQPVKSKQNGKKVSFWYSGVWIYGIDSRFQIN